MKRECEKIRVELSAYLDNEVNEEERSLIVQHLNKCPDCGLEFEEIKRIQRVFSVERLEASPYLESKVLNRIKEENIGVQFIIKKLVPVLASVLIIVASVYFLLAKENIGTIDDYILGDTLEVETYEE